MKIAQILKDTEKYYGVVVEIAEISKLVNYVS